MNGGSQNQASPFRSKPWLLEHVRTAVRAVRLKRIRIFGSMRFTYGDQIVFGAGADIRAPNFVELGHHVAVGKKFTCEADLRVGNYVLISSNVSVVGKDHPFDDPNKTVYSQQRVDNSVVEIGNDTLIGFGTILVGSVKVGDGCIVGAGSVVSRDLPPYTICAGVPARPIRERYTEAPR